MSSYPGIGRALLQLVVSPRRLFDSLREDPRVLAPLLLLAVAFFILAQASFSGPFLAEVRTSLESTEMSPAQRAAILEKMGGTVGRVLALGPMVLSVAITLLVALWLKILLALVRSYFPGPATRFRSLFSLTAHVWIVSAIEFAFKLPLMVAKGTLYIYTSAALLLPGEASRTTLFRLLDEIDLFKIWIGVLLVIGLEAIAGQPRPRAIALVATSWVLLVVGKLAFSSVFTPNVRVG